MRAHGSATRAPSGKVASIWSASPWWAMALGVKALGAPRISCTSTGNNGTRSWSTRMPSSRLNQVLPPSASSGATSAYQSPTSRMS